MINKSKRIVIILLVLLVLLVSATYKASSRPTGEKPNIVLILIDDLGWKDLSCMGSNYYQTPNIDKMAAEGMLFTNAYSAAPVCSPARGAILSGKHPARTKFTAVFSENEAKDDVLFTVAKAGESGRHKNNRTLNGLHYHALPKSEKTMGNYMQELGYVTGYFGKWHVGSHQDYLPPKRGFDISEAYRTEMVGTGAHGHWAGPLRKFAPGLEDYPDSAYVTDVITEKAVNFIKNYKQEPFFLFVSHYAVHTPIQAKKEKIEKYQKLQGDDQDNAVYAAMIESMDESVGKIVEALKETGIEKNTLLVFTSDNGGLTPRATSNYPLLGGKSFAYEAGTRVPFIIKWPENIKNGKKSDHRVIGTDILPTFLDVAGGDAAKLDFDGTSLSPIFHSKSFKQPTLFFHFPHYTSFTSPYSSIIKNDWKLIKFYNNPELPYQLFNLKDDPYEKNDLAGKEHQKLIAMVSVMNQFLDETSAELPLKNPQSNLFGTGINDRYTTYKEALEIWEEMKVKVK